MRDPVLQTLRLSLREMSLEDPGFVASMLAHPEVMRFLPRCYSREEAEDRVRRQRDRYARGGYAYWLLTAKATGVRRSGSGT
jgi:RimJ/RimL family protein N-acetyltransferase